MRGPDRLLSYNERVKLLAGIGILWIRHEGKKLDAADRDHPAE